MQSHIKQNLFLGLTIILLFLFFVGGLSLWQLQAIDRSYSKLISERAWKVSEAKSILAAHEYMAIMIKSYMITGNRHYIDQYFLESERAEQGLKNLRQYVHTAAGKKLLEDLETKYQNFKEKAEIAMQNGVPSRLSPEILPLSEVQGMIDASRNFVSYQEDQLQKGREENHRQVRTVLVVSLVALIIGAALVVLFLLSLSRRIRQEAGTYSLVLTHNQNAIIIIDDSARIIGINPMAEKIFNLSGKELSGKKYAEVFGSTVKFDYPFLQVLDDEKERYNEEFVFERADGQRFVLMIDALPFYFDEILVGAALFARDITERKFKEELLRRENQELQGLAIKDGLTGLYNYRYLCDRLGDEMLKAMVEKNYLALLMLDIDNFKQYNDIMGHPAGDDLLKEFGQVLLSTARPQDVVARYGNDEFAIIMPETDSTTAREIAESLLDKLEKHPFSGREQMPEGKLSVSTGFAVYPTNATTTWGLVKAADQALSKAKRSSGYRVEPYFSALSDLELELKNPDSPLTYLIKTLLELIDIKDHYTYAHTERVVHYATLTAQELNLSIGEINRIRLAAFVHDLGKIRICRQILNKPAPLTRKEWELIKQHPLWGVSIIRPIRALEQLIPMVMHHHEHFDGSGYPAGLEGDQIPLGAQIIAVADSFDAMVSDRPYRPARPWPEAVQELCLRAGSQFNPTVVEAFLAVLSDLKESSPDGRPWAAG